MLTVHTPREPVEGAVGRSAPSQIQTREELGTALTALRVAAGLSVRDVVRLVPSLTLGTASGWFSGQHAPTRASEATLVAAFPRYLPGRLWWVMKVPLIREVLGTNLVVLLRKADPTNPL